MKFTKEEIHKARNSAVFLGEPGCEVFREALDEIENMQEERVRLRAVLQVILDCVDYTNGACRSNEMVAAVLPVQIINLAKERLANNR